MGAPACHTVEFFGLPFGTLLEAFGEISPLMFPTTFVVLKVSLSVIIVVRMVFLGVASLQVRAPTEFLWPLNVPEPN